MFSARGYCFVDAKTGQSIFSIASISNENATNAARQSTWAQLVQKGEITYVCSLGEAAESYGLTVAKIRELFDLIEIDWNTGET